MCNPECCWVDEYLAYADAKYVPAMSRAPEDAPLVSDEADPWDVPPGQGGACTRCVGNA